MTKGTLYTNHNSRNTTVAQTRHCQEASEEIHSAPEEIHSAQGNYTFVRENPLEGKETTFVRGNPLEFVTSTSTKGVRKEIQEQRKLSGRREFQSFPKQKSSLK